MQNASGRLKSRTYRRVKVRLAKRLTTHFERKKPSKHVCGSCGRLLQGVLRERPYKMRTLQKTKKRPSRPYGGVLCSDCSRELLKEKIRSMK